MVPGHTEVTTCEVGNICVYWRVGNPILLGNGLYINGWAIVPSQSVV